MKSVYTRNSVLTLLQSEIENNETRLLKVQNNKTPSAPIYDLPTNPPEASIEGQIALDQQGKLWWYIDGDWHTC